MASVISFFILLFVTYSYSLPVAQKFGSSTPQYQFTTGTTTVEHGEVPSMQLLSDEESTGVPNLHKVKSGGDSSSEEATTLNGVTFSPRGWNEYSSSTSSSSDESNEKRSWDENSSTTPSSEESNEKRSWHEFSSTTMESSTEFDRRAMNSHDSQEEPETTTMSFSEHQMGNNKKFEPPSSSVDSFGQFTGLLQHGQSSTLKYQHHDQPTEESTTEFPSQHQHHDQSSEESTTQFSRQHQHHDQSSEESTTQFPSQHQQPQKTISIIPGKITETKIYTNVDFFAASTPTDVETRAVVKKNPSRGIPGPKQQLPKEEIGR